MLWHGKNRNRGLEVLAIKAIQKANVGIGTPSCNLSHLRVEGVRKAGRVSGLRNDETLNACSSQEGGVVIVNSILGILSRTRAMISSSEWKIQEQV